MPDIAGQRYVIERARGYSSGFSKIYDETRFVNGIIYLLGSGRGSISVIPSDDNAYNKTFTLIKAVASGTFPSCITDWNDATYCQWSITTYLTTDLFYVDMGASWSGAIRAYVYNNGISGLNLLIFGSNDASTWTQISSVAGPVSGAYGDTFSYVSGYRYYKLSTSASSVATGAFINIYSFEAYPDSSLPFNRSFTGRSIRLAVFVYSSYYQLLEVVTGV
jgi:hypothetical protein